MDTNYNTKVMMDIVRLETEVRQKAKDYLKEITEDNLKEFAESTKYIAQSVLENYFLAVDKLYTNGALKIEDDDIFNKFIDFHDGYRAQMKKWSSDNAIKIREMKIDPSLKFPGIEDKEIRKALIIGAGLGTLVAVGLYIFTEKWITVAAELLVLGAAAYTYKKSKDNKIAFEVRKYEIQIKKEKARLVNGLIKDLKTWLSNAEKYSNEIIISFGIN